MQEGTGAAFGLGWVRFGFLALVVRYPRLRIRGGFVST